jgi:beta-glucosidase
LASKLGEHYIKGSQGNSLKNRSCVATCLKHYIGYSYPVNGLDRSEAYIPEKLLRDVFLPPFAAGVAAGSPTVMINSGNVNGIPGHMNGFYIDDILKGELKFEGFTVSDWEVSRIFVFFFAF